MAMAQKIRDLLDERHCSQAKLAELLGTTRSNLHDKLVRDNFSESDLLKIAEALDCDFEASFVLRDSGKHI